MSLIDINKIDLTARYEGYLWISNEISPHIYNYDKQLDKKLLESINPFVVEGFLYNKENRKSYYIKNVDGKQYIYSYEVSDEDLNNKDMIEEYIAHRMGDHTVLKFLRYWKEEQDNINFNFPVLVFDKLVFIGFKTREEVK